MKKYIWKTSLKYSIESFKKLESFEFLQQASQR